MKEELGPDGCFDLRPRDNSGFLSHQRHRARDRRYFLGMAAQGVRFFSSVAAGLRGRDLIPMGVLAGLGVFELFRSVARSASVI